MSAVADDNAAATLIDCVIRDAARETTHPPGNRALVEKKQQQSACASCRPRMNRRLGERASLMKGGVAAKNDWRRAGGSLAMAGGAPA